jgi:hypothetical protein
MLVHFGLPAEAPPLACARGPPLEAVNQTSTFDLSALAPAPEYERDQNGVLVELEAGAQVPRGADASRALASRGTPQNAGISLGAPRAPPLNAWDSA